MDLFHFLQFQQSHLTHIETEPRYTRLECDKRTDLGVDDECGVPGVAPALGPHQVQRLQLHRVVVAAVLVTAGQDRQEYK